MLSDSDLLSILSILMSRLKMHLFNLAYKLLIVTPHRVTVSGILLGGEQYHWLWTDRTFVLVFCLFCSCGFVLFSCRLMIPHWFVMFVIPPASPPLLHSCLYVALSLFCSTFVDALFLFPLTWGGNSWEVRMLGSRFTYVSAYLCYPISLLSA